MLFGSVSALFEDVGNGAIPGRLDRERLTISFWRLIQFLSWFRVDLLQIQGINGTFLPLACSLRYLACRLRHRDVEGSETLPAHGNIPAPRGHRSGKLPKERPTGTERGDEADDILSCKPEIGKYAHFKDDVVLVWRFASLIHGFAVEVGERSLEKSSAKHDTLYKKVLQGIRLMHLCEYHYADVVLTLAYASVYFRSAFNNIGQKMSDYEAAHVCVLLIYLAHSFLLDETCPLRTVYGV
ncbi:unnamed protein product [Symbiodinium pilosum]|uniref:Uncharacterized protein n=1 Tax=Symbiodinium pilosum TaxID=2952 RepID=A0A812UPE3_SYMPI|nr:unnamed protein product [Symbiodinium pilosum]